MASTEGEPFDPATGSQPAPEHDLPRDLPPVEPPSAGLIVQLFLVPALIVAVIVGVYALFGKLASTEQDWRQLAVDVRSENPYIRWRGALGLAQMLDADNARNTDKEPLRENTQIAEALADLYRKLITVPNPDEDELKEIEFLSKALGRMAVPQTILPVLSEGIDPARDRGVRKHSLIGLAMLAGTMHQQQKPLQSPEVEQKLIEISQESDLLFRHEAAYLLGLFPSQQTTLRLEALLEGGDDMTRLNAAIAFARNGSLQGLPILRDTVRDAIEWKLDPRDVKNDEQRNHYFERQLMISNAMKALASLNDKLSAEDRQSLSTDLAALRDVTQDNAVRSLVIEVLDGLARPVTK